MGRLITARAGYIYQNAGESPIQAGDAVVVGKMFGLAAAQILPGESGWVRTDGVWELPADSSEINAGAIAYWDASNERVTGTASTNAPIGVLVEKSASGALTAKVLVNAAFSASGSASGSGSGSGGGA